MASYFQPINPRRGKMEYLTLFFAAMSVAIGLSMFQFPFIADAKVLDLCGFKTLKFTISSNIQNISIDSIRVRGMRIFQISPGMPAKIALQDGQLSPSKFRDELTDVMVTHASRLDVTLLLALYPGDNKNQAESPGSSDTIDIEVSWHWRFIRKTLHKHLTA